MLKDKTNHVEMGQAFQLDGNCQVVPKFVFIIDIVTFQDYPAPPPLAKHVFLKMHSCCLLIYMIKTIEKHEIIVIIFSG